MSCPFVAAVVDAVAGADVVVGDVVAAVDAVDGAAAVVADDGAAATA